MINVMMINIITIDFGAEKFIVHKIQSDFSIGFLVE